MLLLGYALMLAACGGGGGTSDTATAQPAAPATPAAPTAQSIDAQLRSLLEQNHLTAPAKLVEPDALFNLGLNLFQSPLLSGNRKVSCSSCHPIGNAGLDNLPLGIGVNGSGSPPNRSGLPVLHRNTPSLINAMVGGRSFMFWDGRVGYQDGMFTTPAGDQLPTGLQSVVAAQALFPLLSRTEMLGDYDPADVNELAELNPPGAVVENNPRPVWNGIMARLRADATFSGLLQTAYPGVALEQMDIAFVGNALAAYQARRWYDFGATNELHGYIAGTNEISDSAKRGGILFFDKAGCVQCHSGPLLTDQKFHNLAVPQIGPGFASGASETPPRDKGRFDVTGKPEDLYAFLTPSLWEVKNTYPYFHNGVYSTLEEVIRHHLNAAATATAFRCSASAPQENGAPVACRDSTDAPALYQDMVTRLAPELKTLPALGDDDIADLVAFLQVLSDGNNTSQR